MPPRNWMIRISDILESIDKILKYTVGMKFEDFKADSKTIDAVVRNQHTSLMGNDSERFAAIEFPA